MQLPPDVLELRIEGVVEDIGEGGTDECFGPWYGRLGDYIEADDPNLDEAKWVSFRTAEGELHRVEVIAPGGFQWSASVGESLIVRPFAALAWLRPHRVELGDPSERRGARVLDGDRLGSSKS